MRPSGKITVHGQAPSSNAKAATWGVGEPRLTFRFLERGHGLGGLDAPEFRACNPYGSPRMIQVGDVVVRESRAITRRLADCCARSRARPAFAEHVLASSDGLRDPDA